MWTLPQHHKKIARFYKIISLLENKNTENSLKTVRDEIIGSLGDSGDYKGRQNTDTTSAANHNIDEPFFYGFIYKFNKKVFVSEYGKIMYKVWGNKNEVAIVFLFSLFNIQFSHPTKKGVTAKLYPFRIIFKVLLDSRINGEISGPEFFFMYKLEVIESNEIYENLISDILKYRKSKLEIKDYFLGQEDEFIKCQCSIQYFLGILKDIGLLKNCKEEKKENEHISSTKRRDSTSINLNSVEFNTDYKDILVFLNKKYSIYEKPRENPIPSDLISEIFNFIDNDIYNFISISRNIDTSLASEIYQYSIDSEKCYEFEEKINDAFKLFYNVKSEVVGGAGEPDFVAAYLPIFPNNSEQKIFTGDAKSTKNQLSTINPGRLKQHMRKYKSNFTIVVTPKYSPASKQDIKGENIVILSSLALSEVTRQIIINQNKPDFGPFYEVIMNNLGEDVSEKFYDKIDEIYGINL